MILEMNLTFLKITDHIYYVNRITYEHICLNVMLSHHLRYIMDHCGEKKKSKKIEREREDEAVEYADCISV